MVGNTMILSNSATEVAMPRHARVFLYIRESVTPRSGEFLLEVHTGTCKMVFLAVKDPLVVKPPG